MIKLLGVLFVIVGFALKLNPIGIVIIAGILTGMLGGMNIVKILQTLGSTFVDNRYMSLFIMMLPIIATLERNGLKEISTRFIAKIKQATPGKVTLGYGIFRVIFAAFNVSFGGVVGFVRPIIYPMATGTLINKFGKVKDEDAEEIKAVGAREENIAWFFGQVLFIADSGILLVKGTLDPLGYTITPLKAVEAEIPVTIISIILSGILLNIMDKKMLRKYTTQADNKSQSEVAEK